jgi:hypothetical protein
MGEVVVDQEMLAALTHKLIFAMSELAKGYGEIATELESGAMPVADVARMVRELEKYATAMAKEMSE